MTPLRSLAEALQLRDQLLLLGFREIAQHGASMAIRVMGGCVTLLASLIGISHVAWKRCEVLFKCRSKVARFRISGAFSYFTNGKFGCLQQPESRPHAQLRLIFVDRSAKLLFEAEMQLVPIYSCLGAKRSNRHRCGGIKVDLLPYLRQLAALGGGNANGGARLRSSTLPVLKQQSQQVERDRSHGEIVPGAR